MYRDVRVPVKASGVDRKHGKIPYWSPGGVADPFAGCWLRHCSGQSPQPQRQMYRIPGGRKVASGCLRTGWNRTLTTTSWTSSVLCLEGRGPMLSARHDGRPSTSPATAVLQENFICTALLKFRPVISNDCQLNSFQRVDPSVRNNAEGRKYLSVLQQWLIKWLNSAQSLKPALSFVE